MKTNTAKFSRLLSAGSLALAFGTFVPTVMAQVPGSTGSVGGNSVPPANAPVPSASSSAAATTMDSSKLNPKAGVNNDPALQEPNPGPTGAPGVSTESGSPDANGMHSNATAPMPTP
jgi:hypothetical protein